MKIVLLDASLEFVNTGGKVIHAREHGMAKFDPTWDLSRLTLCGREIKSGLSVLPERALASDKVCKHCIKSLATYTGGAKRLNATPFVRFEQSEVQA